jgi:hypothetical protein
MFEDLRAHLTERIGQLQGEWVIDKNTYDAAICRILEMDRERGRYWDARWGQYKIEFKKGKSIWIDLVRYAETVLKVNGQASQKTVTLFFIPNILRDAIDEIICVETERLIHTMGLTEMAARALVDLSQRVPHALNAQASLTIKDVRGLRAFSVP